MQKKTVTFAVLVFLAFISRMIYASPFLVCDPQVNVTSYVVSINGTIEEVPAQVLGDNSTRLHYDIGGLADGSYICSVKAKNFWGESAPVPFSFSIISPECPSVLDISAQ